VFFSNHQDSDMKHNLRPISESWIEKDTLWLWDFCWKYRKTIVASSLIPAVLVAGLSFFLTNLYPSTSKIAYQGAGQSSLSSLSALASVAGLGDFGATDPSGYILDVAKSRPFLQGILDRKWLHNGDSINLKTILDPDYDTSRSHWQDMRIQLLQILGERITCSKDNQTGVITIFTLFESPELSFAINQFAVQRLDSTFQAFQRAKSVSQRAFIESRYTEIKSNLDRTNSVLEAYQRSNRSALPFDLRMDSLVMEANIQKALFMEIRKQLEVAKIEEKRNSPQFLVVEPSTWSFRKDRPARMLMVFGALVLGAMFSLLAHLAWAWLNGIRRQTPHQEQES